MKKIFFAVALLGAMVSCDNSDVVEKGGNAIGFRMSAKNSVRAKIDNNTLTEFNVWAFMKESDGSYSPLMENVWVNNQNKGHEWVYSPIAYWPVGKSVDFYSVYPSNEQIGRCKITTKIESDKQTIEYVVLDGQNAWSEGAQDFVYAVNKNETYTGEKVPVYFLHGLSEVLFAVKNENPNLKIEITGGLFIENAHSSGLFTLPNQTTSVETTRLEEGTWSFPEGADALLDLKTYCCPLDLGNQYPMEVTPIEISVPEGETSIVKQLPHYNEANFYVVPQDITPWNPSVDPTNEQNGSYLLAYVKYTTPTGAVLYEGKMAVPFKWEIERVVMNRLDAGIRYKFTLNLSKNGGLVPPDGVEPGTPILRGIEFDTTVRDYIDAEWSIN